MKKLLSLSVVFLLLFALAACNTGSTPPPVDDGTSADAADTTLVADPATEGATDAEETTAPAPEAKIAPRVLALMGPTGMGMSSLMEQDEQGAASLDYTFNLFNAPDVLTAEVIKGEYDIAAVPVNVASILYKKTAKDLYFLGVNTLGVLHVLENGESVKSVADLKGKTIYASGQGSTPEYIFNALLAANGLDPAKDVTVGYMATHAELASALIAGKVTLGVLPEPNVTTCLMQNSSLRRALDVTAEYKTAAGKEIVQGCVIVRKAFADEHPEAVAAFVQDYAASVAFVNEKPAEASLLIEKFGIVPKAALAEKAIGGSNIVCITGEDGKKAMSSMLDVLFAANPASIGGELPDDGFYYAS